MKICALALLWICYAISCILNADRVDAQTQAVLIQVDRSRIINEIPVEFLSIGLDSSIIRRHWCGFNFTKGALLAKALQPAYLRLGGSEADFLLFQPDAPPFPPMPETGYDGCDIGHYILNKNFTFPGIEWDRFYAFIRRSKLRLIFDFNVLLRDRFGNWDERNARQFLLYSQKRGYTFDLELGNEPSSFNHSVHRWISPKQLAADYLRLKHLTDGFSLYAHSKLIGPSVTNVAKRSSRSYLKRFLIHGGDVVDAVTFHQYYVKGKTATLAQFLNQTILDSLQLSINAGLQAARPYGKPVWIGETASAWGGGAANLSNTYASGFMFIDKLCMSAKMGIKLIIRQSFYHGYYALLDKTMKPNPDFWLSVLFKKLIGTRVFNVFPDHIHGLRLYGFSSKSTRNETVVAVINLDRASILLDFRQDVDVYLLEPEDNGLQSRSVTLNGTPLRLVGDELPAMPGSRQRSPVLMPGERFGFFQIK